MKNKNNVYSRFLGEQQNFRKRNQQVQPARGQKTVIITCCIVPSRISSKLSAS